MNRTDPIVILASRTECEVLEGAQPVIRLVPRFQDTPDGRRAARPRRGTEARGQPWTARPKVSIRSSSDASSGPCSTAARFSRSSEAVRGPVSTTSTLGLVRQKR
jgi:hypothetical protein